MLPQASARIRRAAHVQALFTDGGTEEVTAIKGHDGAVHHAKLRESADHYTIAAMTALPWPA